MTQFSLKQVREFSVLCAKFRSEYLALIIVFFDKTNKYNKIVFAFGKGMTFFEDKIIINL